MKVINVNGITDVDCKCESWLDHWLKFSGQEPSYCPVAECMNTIETAAHVQKDSKTDQKWYILPLCHKHDGMIGQSFEVNGHFELVSADISKTCGKPGKFKSPSS